MNEHSVAPPPLFSEQLRHPDVLFPDSTTGTANDPQPPGDAELTRAIGRSDMMAFAEVYRRHAGHVRAMAARLCGVHADDVVQDVFLRLWERPERFNPQLGSLTSFLLALAHDRAVDVTRAEERRRAREAGDGSRRPTTEDRVEVHALAQLEAVAVRGFLHRLPDAERESIALAYLGGHTYREVAVLLQQPEGTVKSRVRTGLARLAGWIEEASQTRAWNATAAAGQVA